MVEEVEQAEPLPSIEELKKDVQSAASDPRRLQRHFQQRFNIVAVHGQKEYAHLKGLQDHYRHKSRWSGFLMVLMGFMVLFQSFLLYMVGTGNWDFTAYEWLLPALLVQNLAQVVGLAVFVVKALFKDMKWD